MNHAMTTVVPLSPDWTSLRSATIGDGHLNTGRVGPEHGHQSQVTLPVEVGVFDHVGRGLVNTQHQIVDLCPVQVRAGRPSTQGMAQRGQ